MEKRKRNTKNQMNQTENTSRKILQFSEQIKYKTQLHQREVCYRQDMEK